MRHDPDCAHRHHPGHCGFRLRVTHIEAEEKMNQDKPAESVRRILAHLRGESPYANPALAERMERVNAEKLTGDRPAPQTVDHQEPTDA